MAQDSVTKGKERFRDDHVHDHVEGTDDAAQSGPGGARGGAGDRVRYVIFDNTVRVLPVRPVGRLFGALRHDGPPTTLEDMERAVAEGACEA